MSTSYFRFLTARQVKRLYITNLFVAQPTQPVYLESALFSPQQHKNYGQNDVFQLADVLAQKIILNHAYQDGNKRIALLAADMFLKINGYKLQEQHFTNDEVDQLLQNAHVATATSQWDAEVLGSFYKIIATPVTNVTPEIQSYIEGSEEC